MHRTEFDLTLPLQAVFMSMRYSPRDSRALDQRKTTPLLLEQLEQRTLMAFDALDGYVQALNVSASHRPSALVSPRVGAAPTFDRPISIAGGTTITGTSATFSALGRDDGGESKLSYSWQTIASPSGAQVRFARNNSNLAKETTLTFDRAGSYIVRVTMSDTEGNRTSNELPFNVASNLKSLGVRNANGATVQANATMGSPNASESFTLIGMDQFGNVMSTTPASTWQAITKPNGSNVKFTTNGNNTTVSFDQAGTYSLRVSSGSLNQQFNVNVSQSLRSLLLKGNADSTISPTSPVNVTANNQRVSVVGLDQFNRSMPSTPKVTWTLVNKPSGGAASVSMSGNTAAITFTSVGSYTLRAQAESVSATASFNVSQSIETIKIKGATGQEIGSNGVSSNSLVHSFTATAYDQFGAMLKTQPTFVWEVTAKPSGANPRLSTSGSTVTTTFDRAGAYTLRVSAGGRTLSIPISIAQTLGSFSFIDPSGSNVSSSSLFRVSGTSKSLTIQGKDQSGNVMNFTSSVTWSTISAPSGGTATATVASGTATINFSRAGNYTLRANVGNLTQTVTFTVEQAFTSIVALTSSSQTLSNSSPTSVSGTSTTVVAQGRDQFGQPLLTQPTFSWSTASSPSNGVATYKVTGSQATVTFNQEGQYSTRITAAGKSITVPFNVLSTVTRVSVTPGTASVRVSEQQAFKVQAFNQFQQSMTLPSNTSVAWSVSSGTINNAGLFTAGSTTGSATVTARIGSVSGTASVQITASNSLANFQDVAMSSLIAQLYSDNELNRADVISILRSAGDDGTVSSAELADLRLLVSATSNYTMPGYVRELAKDVVNNNPANLHYQGQAAGNLAAGSNAALLNNLVNKWFLGADLPEITGSGISYRESTGTLFATAPSTIDAKQGALGDCYFIASLTSIAESNPDAVRNLFIDNGDGTYTVRFYAGALGAYFTNDGLISSGFSSGSGTADYVTVNLSLPTYWNGTLAYSGAGLSATSASTTLWVALAEKAYAQWNETGNAGRDGTNRYSAIEAGWMSDVNAQVLGYNSTSYEFTPTSKQAMINALAAHKAVTLGTNSNPGNGFYGSHAYTITGYNASTDKFTAYNPWGSSHPGPVSWAQLTSSCTQFVIADPSGSVAIAGANVRSSFESAPLIASPCFNKDTPFSQQVPECEAESVGVTGRPESNFIAEHTDTNPTSEHSSFGKTVSLNQDVATIDEPNSTIRLIDEVMYQLGLLS